MNRSAAIGIFFFANKKVKTLAICALILVLSCAFTYAAYVWSTPPAGGWTCHSDADCDDSDGGTYDYCRKAATSSSSCYNSAPDIQCSMDIDCSDGNSSTIDVCNNDNTVSSYCVIVTGYPSSCANDAACADANSMSEDKCHDAGGAHSWCSHLSYKTACYTDNQCDDSNAQTWDFCEDPWLPAADCNNEYCNIVCANDTACDDSNSCTIDVCNNDGTCDSVCNNIATFTCDDDGDCADDNPLTYSRCISPGACESYCDQNYSVYVTLINEESGNAFDLADVNILRVYSPDFDFSFDFKGTGDNNLRVDTNSFGESLRFEIQHTLGNSFTRDFDLEVIHNLLILTGDVNFRICVPEYQTLYAQYLESKQIRPVAVYNPTSDCYIIADFTKYAYQIAYLATAYTIDMPYILYMWDNNNVRITLANIEGAIASEINLDTLEFALTTYAIVISSEGLHVSRAYDETLLFYYKNLAGGNASVNIKVYDDTTEIFDYTETDLPNEFSVYFDHTGLEISADLLRAVVTVTDTSDNVESFTTYFTVEGFTGVLNPQLAVIIAFVFFVFALTFVAYRFALGWFGILAGLVALAILTLAPPTWYVRFAQGIMVIIIIFIGIIFKEETAKVT